MGAKNSTMTGIEAGTATFHGAVNVNLHGPQGDQPRHKSIGSVSIPHEPGNFIGRTKELRLIHSILSESNYAVVQGMAGIGKTSIAIAYLSRYCSGYDNLIWLDSETKEAMTERFKQVAKRLDLKTTEQLDKIQSFTRSEIEEIYAALCEHPTILVFDNAEGYSDILGNRDGIHQFLPPIMHSESKFLGLGEKVRYKVIVTTRNIKGWEKLCTQRHLVPLEKWSDTDSKDFIIANLKTAGIPDANTNWKILADYYDHLPIAIESATASINTNANRRLVGNSYTIVDWMEEFHTPTTNLLSTQPDEEHEAHQKVQGLWEKTFKKLQSEDGGFPIHLLNVMAFLSPDGVQLDFFLAILKRIDSVSDAAAYMRDKMEPAVDLLKGLSLFRRSNDTIIVHRLLQANRMKDMQSKGTALIYAEKLCQSFSERSSWLQGKQLYAFGNNLEQFMHHETILQALEDNLDMMDKFPASPGNVGYERIFKRQSDQHGPHAPQTIATFYSWVQFLSSCEKHELAAGLLKKQLSLQEDELGQDDHRTIQTRRKLIDHLRNQGGFEQLWNLLTSNWNRQKSEIGPDDERTLDTRNELLSELNRKNKHAQALKLLQSDWARQKSSLGPNDPRTIDTRNGIACVLWFQDEYDKALDLVKTDSKTEKEARKKLAQIILAPNPYADAHDSLQLDFYKQKSLFGPDDSRTVVARKKLIQELCKQDKYTQARDFLQSECNRQQSSLGPNDSRTIETQNELKELVSLQKASKEVLELLEIDWNTI